VKKTTRDYGLGSCCNHDLRRWDAYGGGGAGNLEARRRVLRGRRVKEGSLVFGEKKADCDRRLERCRSSCGSVVFEEVLIGYRLFPLRQ